MIFLEYVLLILYKQYLYFISLKIYTLGDTGFFRLQGIVKTTVSMVFEDLKFKMSEGLDQN